AAGHRVLTERAVAAVGVRARDRVGASVDEVLAKAQRTALAESVGSSVRVEQVRPGLGQLALLPEVATDQDHAERDQPERPRDPTGALGLETHRQLQLARGG